MKSTTLQRFCVCVLQAVNLLAIGCSGEQPNLPPAAMVNSTAVESTFNSQHPTSAAADFTEKSQGTQAVLSDEIPENDLAWNDTEQRRVVMEGAGGVLFKFQMQNVSQHPMVIEKVNASCGCTTIDTREMPFTLAPGDSEELQISMSIAGKFGTVTKSVLVQGSRATWTLLVTTEIKPPSDEVLVPGVPDGGGMSAGVRGRNIELATTDRQAVFKGDCATCHSRPATRQIGYGLYIGACAICHDAKHRASMVPDLRVVDESRDAVYWREHITDGIEGTLMPAFATEKRGILSDEQIESLVKFLVETPLEPIAHGR